jgi:hypothetical protein
VLPQFPFPRFIRLVDAAQQCSARKAGKKGTHILILGFRSHAVGSLYKMPAMMTKSEDCTSTGRSCLVHLFHESVVSSGPQRTLTDRDTPHDLSSLQRTWGSSPSNRGFGFDDQPHYHFNLSSRSNLANPTAAPLCCAPTHLFVESRLSFLLPSFFSLTSRRYSSARHQPAAAPPRRLISLSGARLRSVVRGSRWMVLHVSVLAFKSTLTPASIDPCLRISFTFAQVYLLHRFQRPCSSFHTRTSAQV